MSYTDISLCSKAMLKIGAQRIVSFDDGSVEGEVASNLYPIIRDGLLSSYPWSFAVSQMRLPRVDITPVADYQYAYQLPSDFLRVMSAGSGKGRGGEYKILRDRIHTNIDNLILTYVFRPYEGNFPAYFSEILISKLAAEFCLPITESTSRAEYLTKKAENEFARAKSVDAQQATPTCFEDFSLVEARK